VSARAELVFLQHRDCGARSSGVSRQQHEEVKRLKLSSERFSLNRAEFARTQVRFGTVTVAFAVNTSASKVKCLNNTQTLWPDCMPGYVHSNYLMLGKGHIDSIDDVVKESVVDLKSRHVRRRHLGADPVCRWTWTSSWTWTMTGTACSASV
jgi:hypothetical protein